MFALFGSDLKNCEDSGTFLQLSSSANFEILEFPESFNVLRYGTNSLYGVNMYDSFHVMFVTKA